LEALVLGHKNPDMDSVVSAIAVADLKSKLGVEAIPAVQGKPSPEVHFILDKFGVDVPRVVKLVTGHKVFLVDHSDMAQSPDDLAGAEILGIVDHHKLGDITTGSPLEMWVWPVGCSCTVIKNMYDFHNVEISRAVAGLMLCAILSDTVMFKSVTCTEKDRMAAKELAAIAGVEDVLGLGMEMFKVKSAVEGTPIRDLVFRDYKDFDMHGKKVGVGQLEVVDLALLESIREQLAAEIETVRGEGRHSVFLMLTDIMREGTEMLCATGDPALVEKAFGQRPGAAPIWLEGVMSRKKQVVPNLEKAFT
jgi:manganese-dependent inorganic pyrophosphatase